jgi:hypothetical protein
MTQQTNDALMEVLSEDGWPVGDEIFIGTGAGTTQAAGIPVRGAAHRVMQLGAGTASAAVVMKSIKSQEAPSMVWLINDSAQAVAVFCAAGDSMAGAANGSFSLTAGNAAVFCRIPAQIKRKGGTSGGGTIDWRPALIS